MSDNATIQFIIRYTPKNGTVEIAGPIQDKILTYGVLEMAKEAVKAVREEPMIQKAQGPLFIPPRGNGHG